MKEKENQNIEWKLSWKDEYLKWICGYANAQGGTLYIGTDDDGNVEADGRFLMLAAHSNAPFVLRVAAGGIDNLTATGNYLFRVM